MAVHAMHNASAADFWMECSLYYYFKKATTPKDWDRPSDAAHRGSLQHTVSEVALPLCLKGKSVGLAVRLAIRKTKIRLKPEEVINVGIAMRAVLELIPEGMDIEVEVDVPLSHEPGSFGKVDVAGYCEDYVLVVDYKFGLGAVSPNAAQLKIYAGNLLDYLRDAQGIEFTPKSRVKLSIIQPALHREAVVRVYTAGDLTKFQHYVEGVVDAQVDGHDRRGAGSLSTCEWCPARAACFHRVNLVHSMLTDLTKESPLADPIIEEIVRSRGAFKKTIEECVKTVIDDAKRFPNWTRARVNNARKWESLAKGILAKLKKAGGLELTEIRSPKQILDKNPNLEKLIHSFTSDQGYHVRLYSGAPKAGANKVAPTKRPKAAKKSAKKKAAKRRGKR